MQVKRRCPGAFENIMNDLVNMIDESKALRYCLDDIFDESFLCPECNYPLVGHRLEKFLNNERIRCGRCGKFFKGVTGTALSGVNIAFRQVIMMFFLKDSGFSIRKKSEIIGVAPATVLIWEKKIELCRCESKSKIGIRDAL